jgi:protein-disulfide isomerase
MRPTLVNGLALLGAVTMVTVACSRGASSTQEARAATASAATADTTTPAATGHGTDSLAQRADASRILGSPSAKLWVIEVSDFQCPYCKQWHDQVFSMVLDNYVKTGKIRLAYVNFPLSIHPHAREAATAAMCAGAQGKFWQMHDALFATQGSWAPRQNVGATFDSLATSLGVNQAQYRSCLTSPSIAALIDADQERARSGGVQSTPSFWVGTHMVEGAVPADYMRQAIDSALATTK